jgi:peptidoglycan/xylan/chitin deacetylase (PgdA/CDA1 family)
MVLALLLPLAASVPLLGPAAQTGSGRSMRRAPVASVRLPAVLGDIPRFRPAPTPERPPLAGGPLAPVLSRVPTKQPVMFITIDDGIVRKPEALALVRAAKVPVTLFLISTVADQDPRYFRDLQRSGAVIEAHTLTHPSLRKKPYDFQKNQICGSAGKLAQLFGRRPVLFRPPIGNYDQTTRRAARDCGMKAVLTWREATDIGHVFYQTAEQKPHAGDIVLMHFRPRFVDDFLAILRAARDAGLTPALLEDYIA